MITRLLGAMREIVGINADTVATYQARIERHKIPLRLGRLDHVTGIDAEHVTDGGKLVHEGNVEIALRILDHLGGLGHLDGRGAVNTRIDDGAVDGGDSVEGCLVLSRYDLH